MRSARVGESTRYRVLRGMIAGYAAVWAAVRGPVTLDTLDFSDRRFDPVGPLAFLDGPVPDLLVVFAVVVDADRRRPSRPRPPRGGDGSGRRRRLPLHHDLSQLLGAALPHRESRGAPSGGAGARTVRGAVPVRRRGRRPGLGGRCDGGADRRAPTSWPVWRSSGSAARPGSAATCCATRSRSTTPARWCWATPLLRSPVGSCARAGSWRRPRS